jgi:asparagine synthase (glutamine-hydrolysing)
VSGFAAVVLPAAARAGAEHVERLAAALAFRGPDALTTWHSGVAGMAHSLLRTTTESATEQQPCSLDGDVWITADARVDGRAELVPRLRSAGRRVSDDAPDAELMLHAWHAWGDACVDHLIGDFAFALWDGRRQRLFCARDHFGVVPFYYALAGDALVVANTLDAVLSWPGVPHTLNERTIGDYLLVGHSADPEAGFFEAVHRLPPAHTLNWEAGCLRVRRYWSPPERAAQTSLPDAEVIERFAAALDVAVTDRMRCDRVATTLSGGLDSGIVTSLAARHAQRTERRLDAYCVGMDWLVPDEEPVWATKAAAWIGVPLHAISGEEWLLTPEYEDAWRTVPEPRFEVRRPALAGIALTVVQGGGRVLLTGFGGDGAVGTRPTHWADLLLAGHWRRLARDGWRYRTYFGRRPPLRGSLLRRLAMRRVTSTPLAPHIDADFARRIGLRERQAELRSKLLSMDPRTALATLPFWTELVSALDPESTGLPLRFRHPFFDVRVLNAVLASPAAPWLFRKTLLRRAGRDLLPPEILERPKSPAAGHAYHEAAVRGYEPWLEDLALTPGLERYVDRQRLLAATRDPAAVSPGRYLPDVLLPMSLAAWLRQRDRATSRGPVATERIRATPFSPPQLEIVR